MIEMRGRIISKGRAEGEALVTKEPISFLGGVDVKTGVVRERGHELEGQCVADKIFVFPLGKGSTGGSYALLEMSERKTAPKAMINVEAETILAVGAIIGGIPLIDKTEKDPLEVIETGDHVLVDAFDGTIKVDKRERGLRDITDRSVSL